MASASLSGGACQAVASQRQQALRATGATAKVRATEHAKSPLAAAAQGRTIGGAGRPTATKAPRTAFRPRIGGCGVSLKLNAMTLVERRQ
jgi:hypothetical protein